MLKIKKAVAFMLIIVLAVTQVQPAALAQDLPDEVAGHWDNDTDTFGENLDDAIDVATDIKGDAGKDASGMEVDIDGDYEYYETEENIFETVTDSVYSGEDMGFNFTGGNIMLAGALPTEVISDLIREYSENMKRVSSGWGFTLGIITDGRVKAWGNNGQGQCNVPADLDEVIEVSAGAFHALALKEDGTVIAWGNNENGECDLPDGLNDVIAISAGGSHSLALKEDGTVISWGGYIPDEEPDRYTVPEDLTNPDTANIIAIDAGGYHSLALKEDGTVTAWGNNSWNQLQIPFELTDPDTAHVAAIAALWGHNLALREDGTVVAWGNNGQGQATVPAGLTDVVAVTGSYSNSMALLADGTVRVWGDNIIAPPDGLSDVIAISSQSADLPSLGGYIALKNDYSIAAWGDTGIPGGASLIPKPEILYGEVAYDNSYIDIYFNMGVFAADQKPLTLANFRHKFYNNGGQFFTVVPTSLTKIDGTEVEGGERVLRFHLDMDGEPTGKEAFEIKPFGKLSVFDIDGIAMDTDQGSGQVRFIAELQSISAMEMVDDNSYMDVTFNMGVYGDGNKSMPVTKEDFILAFMQNDGNATSASISDVTKIDGTSLQGGETELRFHLEVIGSPNGDETIELWAAAGSVYSPSGAIMSHYLSSGPIKLSPPKPNFVSAQLSPDNSYLDITFNTGVYGSWIPSSGELYDLYPVKTYNLRLHLLIMGGGATDVYISSVKAADYGIESKAGELKGGEKTIRAFLNIEGVPTGVEYLRLQIEGVFNSKLDSYATEDQGFDIKMNALTLGFDLPWLEWNNRYIDLNFTSGVYGSADSLSLVTKDDFILLYNKNGGLTENVIIDAITKPDSGDITKAAPLAGGEKTVRAFLKLSNPSMGQEETIEIKPIDDNSIFNAAGVPMAADRTTKKINLYPSLPGALSARLAKDNSYIDVNFNFGIYGDRDHATAVTKEHFYISMYRNDGQATAVSICSVKKTDSIDEGSASTLIGGEDEVRIFLDITGFPSGVETIVVRPGSGGPIYNELGKAPSMHDIQFSDEINLNSKLKIVSASLSEDLCYMDVFFNIGVYGDENHSSPASLGNFILEFQKNNGRAENITIHSVKKDDSDSEGEAGELQGGETVLRFFLETTGFPTGQETLKLSPDYNNPPYSDSGNPIPEGQTTKTISVAIPSPEIITANLARDNSYIDITFNIGVYGDSNHSLGVGILGFKVLVNQNGGDTYLVNITDVKNPDNEDSANATPLVGGEKTLRAFLRSELSAGGGETIEIIPSLDGGDHIYSYSGSPIKSGETTGLIQLNPFPKIISQRIANNCGYIDITFSTGVYGDAYKSLPVTTDSFVLTFERNGGSMLSAGIKSVKKPDNEKESTAAALTGGEQTVRVFLNTVGTASGNETFAIDKKDAYSIFDKDGLAIPEDKYVKPINPSYIPIKIINAVLSQDNSYVDVNFSTGVYGAPDGKSPVTAGHFKSGYDFPFVDIYSVKQTDSQEEESASPLIGGERTLRLFLKYVSIPDGQMGFIVKSTASSGGPGIYSLSGAPLETDKITGFLQTTDMRIKISSAQTSLDNSYVDIVFNKGIYGDKDCTKGVEASDFGLYCYKNQNSPIDSIEIQAVRVPDGITPESASEPSGGETALRFFLNIAGQPTGEESICIEAKTDNIFQEKGYSGYFSTDKIFLKSSSPVMASAVISEDSRYIDITFNTGIYGNKEHTTPVTADDFILIFKQNGGKASNVIIQSIKRTDGITDEAASDLMGGEKEIRLFLNWDGNPYGVETVAVLPADGLSIFSDSGNAMSEQEATEEFLMNCYYPKMVSYEMDEDNKYIDVTFNMGIYDMYMGGVSPQPFIVTMNGDESIPVGKRLLLTNWSLGKSPWEFPPTGGEKTLRFFLKTQGESKGAETFNITLRPEYPVYSIYKVASEGQTINVPINAPKPRMVSVSAANIQGSVQYVDVTFNVGVYGDAELTYPVYPELFELIFNKNGGNAASAWIDKVGEPDNDFINGGERIIRFYIETDGFPDGKETIEIRSRSGSPLYNSSGISNNDQLTTNAIKLKNSLTVVENAKMGDYNRYIDVTFSNGIGVDRSSIYSWDFNIIFNKNGGTAQNVKIKSIKQNNSPIENNAKELGGNEKVLRFFLDVVGVPSGQETIELKPAKEGTLYSDIGVPVPITCTTGQIKLLSLYPVSWPETTDSNIEPFGWMSDLYISNSNTEALVLKNNGEVVSPTYSFFPKTGVKNAIAVAAGSGFGLALKRDGTVTGWGDIKIPDGLSGVRAIDASHSTAYVLLENATIGRFTKEGVLERLVNQTPEPAVSFSVGSDDHWLILYKDGSIGGYGNNTYDQCIRPSGLMNVKAVAAGDGYSLALKEDGTVAGWGNIKMPDGLTDVAAISAGSNGYMVLKNDKTVLLYNRNGNTIDIPTGLDELNDIIAVSAGDNLYSVIRENGDADIWTSQNVLSTDNIYVNKLYVIPPYRDNTYFDIIIKNSEKYMGISGIDGPLIKEDLKLIYKDKSPFVYDITIKSIGRANDINPSAALPVQVGDDRIRVFLDIKGAPNGTETIEIMPASGYSVYTTAGDSLLGSQNVVVPISTMWKQKEDSLGNRISAGWQHGLAIREDGTVLAWGSNADGRTDVPLDLGTAMQVSAGYHHSVALKSDSTIEVWGDNYYGQCNIPYGLKNIKQISAGGYHTLALDYGGKVYAWGDNFYQQCQVPEGLSDVIQIEAGGHHSLALKKDGTIVTWGDNHFGQQYRDSRKAVFDDINGIKVLAAGEDFSLYRMGPLEVLSKGDNRDGQCDIPPLKIDNNETIKAVSAGYHHALALNSEGKIIAWGDNSKGQCNIPTKLSSSRIVAISAGAFFNMAIDYTGKIIAWGDNDANQCDMIEDISPPYFISSALSPDNSFADITFSERVYSKIVNNTLMPLTADSLNLVFDRGNSPNSNVTISIKSVKKNDNTKEDLASDLTGGETTVRVFLDVIGNIAGTETLEFKAKDGNAICDSSIQHMSPSESSGILRMNPNSGTEKFVDSTSVGDCILNFQSLMWYHEGNLGANSKRILVVGLKCDEKESPTYINSVTVEGKPMTHAVSNSSYGIQTDFYYILDKDLPAEPGKYLIIADYENENVSLSGMSVLLCNAAQMGPEGIGISGAMENTLSEWAYGTLLTTKSNNATIVELLSVGNQKAKENKNAALINNDGLYPISMAIHQGGPSGNVSSCFLPDKDPKTWLSMALAFRNADYPEDKDAEAEAPAAPTLQIDSYLAGENIAFAIKDLGFEHKNLGPMQVKDIIQNGDNLYLQGFRLWSSIYDEPGAGIYKAKTSKDGETWVDATTLNTPKLFSIGGFLYTMTMMETQMGGYPRYFTLGDGLNDPGEELFVGDNYGSVRNFNVKAMAGNSEGTIVAVGGGLGYIRYLSLDLGYFGMVSVSQDNGNTWSERYIDSSILNGVLYFSDRFVAWDDKNVYWSIDGLDWELAANFKGPITVYERNNVLLLTGKNLDDENINLYTSTDGAIWTKAKIVYKDPGLTDVDGFSSIAYARDTYAAVGGNCIAAAKAPAPENVDQPWEFSLYALDMDGVNYITSINNRFYIRYANTVFSSDNLKDWYYESSNSGNGNIINFRGRAISYNYLGDLLIGYIPLNVDYVTPYVNETGVPIDEVITIGFPEGVKSAEVVPKDAIRLVNNASGRLHPIDISFKEGKIVLTPKVTLDYSTNYTVVISEGSVKNTVDTKANTTFTYDFTTRKRIGKPQIVSSSLGSGMDVSAEEPVFIQFDREIFEGENFSRITIAPADKPDSLLNMNIQIDRSSIILTPDKYFENNKAYLITLPGACVIDSDGDLFELWGMEFTVKADDIPPKAVKTLPVNYGERVPAAPTIEVRFDENIKEGENFGQISLKNIRFEINIKIVASIPEGLGLDGKVSNNTLIIELPENTTLELHHTYRVTLPAGSVADMGGNGLEKEFSFVFTEEIMSSSPMFIESNPKNNANRVDIKSNFVLLFDRPIAAGPNYNNFSLIAEGHPDIKLVPEINRNRLILRHEEPMEYGVTYRLRISAYSIGDKNNDNWITEETVLHFTTEEQHIISTLPSYGGTKIFINGIPEIKFDHDAYKGYEFDNITFIGQTEDGDTAVSLRPRLEGNRLLLLATEELMPDTRYTVSLPRGAIRFLDGAVNNQYEFSFTTGAERIEILDFAFSGNIELLEALVEGDVGSFDATECFEDAKEYIWDFGDGSPPVKGGNPKHVFAYKGTYKVILTAVNSNGNENFMCKDVYVVKKPDRDSTLMEVTPKAPALLNAGDSMNYILKLSSSGVPMLNRNISVYRTYSVTEDKQKEHLATLTTDRNGMAEYEGILDYDCQEYYITFTYDDISVRRVMKNAAGLSEISGYVMNDKNQVLKNAIVSMGNRGTVTDKDGFYRITDLLPGVYTMAVSTDFHYDYVSEVSLYQKAAVRNIALQKIVYTKEPLVRQVVINGSVAADGKTFYFLEGIDAELTFKFLIDWRGHEPGTIELKKGDTIIGEGKNNDTLVFNAKNLKKGDVLTGFCYTKDGLKSLPTVVNFHMVESLPGEFPFDLEPVYVDGKYITERYITPLPIKTPVISSIPILKGGPFAFLSDPVYVYGEMGVDGSFYVVSGISGPGASTSGRYEENNMVQKYLAKRSAKTEKEKKLIAAKQSKSYMGSVKLDSHIGVSFYWKYNLSKDSWEFDSGTLHLGISVNASGSAKYGIPGVPLSVSIGGDFEVIMDTYLNAINRNGSIGYGGGVLDMSHIFIEISGGLSALFASAGVYFNGTGAVKIDFSNGDTKYYIEVHGGARASALGWSVKYDFLSYDWGDRSPWLAQLGPKTYGASSQGRQFNLAALNGQDGLGESILPVNTGDMEPTDRDYLDEQSEWLPASTRRGLMITASLQDTTESKILRSSTFPYTDHYITTYGRADTEGAFMVLLEDEATRPILNQTRVKYSVYDGFYWSYPQPIDTDDKTADYAPVAAATDNGIIAAWENLKDILSPDSELGEALAMEEIAVGVYNNGTDSWSDIRNLTKDNYQDHSPNVAVDGGEGLLVWIKSRSNDYHSFLSESYTAENDIMYSKWNGSSFEEPKAAATFEQPIVNASLAFDKGKGLYVFSLDEDHDLNTVTDQEIYAIFYDADRDSWGETIRLTNNIVRDSNPRACFIKGKAFIAWEQNGSIVYMDDADDSQDVKVAASDSIIQNTFTMAVNGDDTLALIGPATAGGNGTDLYEIIYDGVNKLWSKEIRLTEDYSTNRSPSATFVGNELITVYNRDIIEDKVNPADGLVYPTMSNKADLRMTAKSLVHDLAVLEDGVTLSEDNPFPGGLTEISGDIKNNGSFTETSAKVAFYEGDPLKGGRKIGENIIEKPLVPGESTVVTIQWEVPEVMPAEGIYVVVDPDKEIDDAMRTDNTASLLILRPDLELTALDCVPLEDGKYIVTTKITNVSMVDVPGTVISLLYGDGKGSLELIDNLDAGALEAGKVAEVTYLWSPGGDVYDNGKADLIATVDISKPEEENSPHLIKNEDETILDNNINMLTIYEINEAFYKVRIGTIAGGTITASPAIAEAGENITLAITPDSGKRLKAGSLKYNDGTEDHVISGTGFIMPAANVTVTAEFENIPKPDSDHDKGGGGGSTNGKKEPPIGNKEGEGNNLGETIEIKTYDNEAYVIATVKAVLDSEGKATVVVGEKQFFEAIDKAIEEAERLGINTPASVEIKVEAPTDVDYAETVIPKDAFNEAAMDGIGTLKISTPIASIAFDRDTLSSLSEEETGDLKVTVSKVETSSLSQEAQQSVGDRPVFEFNVKSGDKTISHFGGNVSVSIPYIPEESEDTDAIVMYYINAEGNLEIVRDCIYDPVTGTVNFKTKHFSEFIIGYNKVKFKDVGESAWYNKAVSFIAAREITAGTGDGYFSPEARLSRGQFIVMLMKAYDIAPDTSPTDNFADAGNTYYTGYLSKAKKLGISGGVGFNMFAPDKEITRQEMAALLYNALKSLKKRGIKENKDILLSNYGDAEDIAPWAKEAMTIMAEANIISGSGGKLYPMSTTTRAEMAQVIYNLLSR